MHKKINKFENSKNYEKKTYAFFNNRKKYHLEREKTKDSYIFENGERSATNISKKQENTLNNSELIDILKNIDIKFESVHEIKNYLNKNNACTNLVLKIKQVKIKNISNNKISVIIENSIISHTSSIMENNQLTDQRGTQLNSNGDNTVINNDKKIFEKDEKFDFDFASKNINPRPLVIFNIKKDTFKNNKDIEIMIEKYVKGMYRYESYNNIVSLYLEENENIKNLMNEKDFFEKCKKKNMRAIEEGPSIIIHKFNKILNDENISDLDKQEVKKILNPNWQKNRPIGYIRGACMNEKARVKIIKNGLILNQELIQANLNLKQLRQCNQCQKFGHIKSLCTNKPICPNCSSTRHDQCQYNAKRVQCPNCGSKSHTASSKECEKYKEFVKTLEGKEWKYILMNIKYECRGETDVEDIISYIKKKISECEPEEADGSEMNSNTNENGPTTQSLDFDSMLNKINEANTLALTKFQEGNSKTVTDLIEKQQAEYDKKTCNLAQAIQNNFNSAFQEYKNELIEVVDSKIDGKLDDFIGNELNPQLEALNEKVHETDQNVNKIKGAVIALFSNSELVNMKNSSERIKIVERAFSEASLDQILKATNVTKNNKKTKIDGNLEGKGNKDVQYNRRIKLVDINGKKLPPSSIPSSTPLVTKVTKSQIITQVSQSAPSNKQNQIPNTQNISNGPNYQKGTVSSRTRNMNRKSSINVSDIQSNESNDSSSTEASRQSTHESAKNNHSNDYEMAVMDSFSLPHEEQSNGSNLIELANVNSNNLYLNENNQNTQYYLHYNPLGQVSDNIQLTQQQFNYSKNFLQMYHNGGLNIEAGNGSHV
jgi:hypothetical protein